MGEKLSVPKNEMEYKALKLWAAEELDKCRQIATSDDIRESELKAEYSAVTKAAEEADQKYRAKLADLRAQIRDVEKQRAAVKSAYNKQHRTNKQQRDAIVMQSRRVKTRARELQRYLDDFDASYRRYISRVRSSVKAMPNKGLVLLVDND